MANLDPYYIKLKDIFESGIQVGSDGSWPALYYGIFSKVINDNNFKICVEVGIGYGFHADQILNNTNVEKLYLIDPMCYYENDAFANDVQYRFEGFENLRKNIINNLSKHKYRYEWFRTPSLNVTNEQIQDESIDAVFLDGDHSYESVSKDLPFWWKKIRNGGWLLGDDYASCCPGVTKAVDEFSLNNKLNLQFLRKPNSTYPIYYFIKT